MMPPASTAAHTLAASTGYTRRGASLCARQYNCRAPLAPQCNCGANEGMRYTHPTYYVDHKN
ncbi:MAG: hypothetical protein JXB15_17230 [Anaerolineales bacterium]|nr:hypothetical protein [Anaerolineales bacterium]